MRRWSREMILTALADRHRKGLAMNVGAISREDGALYKAAKRNFKGGIAAALVEAGFILSDISYPNRKWTPEKVIEALQERHRKGLAMNPGTISCEDEALYGAAKRNFKGRMAEALISAGFTDISPRRKWTKEKVLHEVLLRHNQGLPLSVKIMMECDSCLVAAAIHLFGSWRRAIEEAMIPYETVAKKRRWSKALVIKEIISLAQREKDLSASFAGKHHNHLYHLAGKYFRGWYQALFAAGIDHTRYWKAWRYDVWVATLAEGKLEKIHKQSIIFAKKRRKHNEHKRDK